MLTQKILLATVAICWIIIFASFAQARECNDGSIEDSDKYKIRSVKINVRYLSLPLPSKGTFYTKSLDSKLLNDVRDAIRTDRNRENEDGSTLSQRSNKISSLPAILIGKYENCVEILEEDVCLKEVGQAKCVDITADPKTIRLSLDNPADNLLEMVPRSNSPTIFANVPKPLLALNPNFGVDYDKELGFSQKIEISTNLLDLNEILNGESIDVKSAQLDFKADAKKSLNNDYYDTNVGVSFTKFLPSKTFEKVYGTAEFSTFRLPNGDAEYFNNAVSIDGGILLNPRISLIKSIILEGGYARDNNRFISDNSALSVRTRENNFHFRALFNGQIKRDVFRVGFWADGGETTDAVFSYKRFAGLVGYAKEFGKSNQTFGLETLFGAGKVSGSIPNYAYFYGNNELKNFIYEASNSSIIQKMPAGPLIRSFGSGQAVNGRVNSLNGSNSYWHFNLNLSIPIAKWSKPLIPNEPIDLDTDDSKCPITTIRDLIKCQAKSGETILAAIYRKKNGLSKEEAAQKANQEFKSINSAISYLVDQANLYSVKPLFMFDAAKFNSFNGANKVRMGIGGGLQLNIVIAKFEAGYMRTVNPQVGDSRGNFIMRLYFQNLF